MLFTYIIQDIHKIVYFICDLRDSDYMLLWV
jgi:hypothetical protein